MRKLSVFLLFIIAISFVNFHSLGRFLVEEPLKIGEMNTAYVTVRNTEDSKVEDVNVKFYIYDLGLRYTSRSNDVSKRDNIVQRLFMYVPEDVKPGYYLTKISVGNDHYRDTQHIFLSII